MKHYLNDRIEENKSKKIVNSQVITKSKSESLICKPPIPKAPLSPEIQKSPEMNVVKSSLNSLHSPQKISKPLTPRTHLEALKMRKIPHSRENDKVVCSEKVQKPKKYKYSSFLSKF